MAVPAVVSAPLKVKVVPAPVPVVTTETVMEVLTTTAVTAELAATLVPVTDMPTATPVVLAMVMVVAPDANVPGRVNEEPAGADCLNTDR